MTGTVINTVAVLIGSATGLLLGSRLPDRTRETIVNGLGLVTVLIGIQMATRTSNVLIVLGSVVLGGIIGEMLNVEGTLEQLGERIENRVNHWTGTASERQDGDKTADTAVSRFSRGFLTASLLFCVGPMAILGSIQDALLSDYSTLTVKSMLDGFASVAFASSLGLGVAFAAIPLFIYQGCLTLGAFWVRGLFTDPMIAEMTATGGLLIVGIGINLLKMARIRVANLLPAIALAPLVVAILSARG